MKRALVIVSIVALLLPVAALAIPNPLRAFFPQMFGLICDANRLCVDDARHFTSARALSLPALTEVTARLGQYESQPTMIFCMSEECYNVFGRRRSSSVAFGGTAVVIGPRGWASHYIQHELIHIAQAQRLGVLRAWRAPEWLTEGMAYSLSGDPRRPLPGELEALRAEFERWYRGELGEALWAKTYAAVNPSGPKSE
jgi:hypothetical protein